MHRVPCRWRHQLWLLPALELMAAELSAPADVLVVLVLKAAMEELAVVPAERADLVALAADSVGKAREQIHVDTTALGSAIGRTTQRMPCERRESGHATPVGGLWDRGRPRNCMHDPNHSHSSHILYPL